MRALLCTREDELARLDWDGAAASSETLLEGLPVRCVAAAGERVLVGTQGGGARLSEDGGAGWERVELPEADVFPVAIGAADGALYAGTEPSRLFVSRDGREWRELEAPQAISSREHWSFPPRPWTHHVRWIAPDPHAAERLLVGIELGGLMASEGGGASFFIEVRSMERADQRRRDEDEETGAATAAAACRRRSSPSASPDREVCGGKGASAQPIPPRSDRLSRRRRVARSPLASCPGSLSSA